LCLRSFFSRKDQLNQFKKSSAFVC